MTALQPGAVDWSIVQSGLFSTWLLDSTLQNVVEANPTQQFEYIGLFQRNSLGPRFGRLSPAVVSEERDLDDARERIRKRPNAQIAYLGLHDAQKVAIPANFAGRRSNFDNDYAQLSGLREASTHVSAGVRYVLRLREDAGWHGRFALPTHMDALLFKSCLDQGGVNDKVWLGPRADTLRLNDAWLGGFLSVKGDQDHANTEKALLNTLESLRLPYALGDVNVSDARVNTSFLEGICWRMGYLCGDSSSAVPSCEY